MFKKLRESIEIWAGFLIAGCVAGAIVYAVAHSPKCLEMRCSTEMRPQLIGQVWMTIPVQVCECTMVER